IDHIRLILHDRPEQFWVIAVVIFQIGILNKNDIAARMGKSVAQRGAFSLVHRLMKHAEGALGEKAWKLIELFCGAVGGTIVDTDNLALASVRERRVNHQLDQFLNGLLLVVHGDDDRDFGLNSRWHNSLGGDQFALRWSG